VTRLRVLVVAKKSVLEQALTGPFGERVQTTLDESPDETQRLHLAHADNAAAIQKVREVLERAGVEHAWERRPTKRSVTGYDLVVTVGGDGTLLSASHAVEDEPVLGVNSSPRFSVGHFCAATADTFEDALAAFREGRLPRLELTRLRVQIHGRKVPYPVLNEVLYAHQNPAGTSHYELCVGSAREAQKSSGIWIASAAGSTAAIASAGGDRMPMEDRSIQYLVREPFEPGALSYALKRGFTAGPIEIVSRTLASGVFIDGHRNHFSISYGDVIRIDTLAPRLALCWPAALEGSPG
jgi:NAD+ kinase